MLLWPIRSCGFNNQPHTDSLDSDSEELAALELQMFEVNFDRLARKGTLGAAPTRENLADREVL